MFILKSLVAALALGLVQDTIAAAAAPACCTNKCGKSVQLAKNGKKDCSAFLIKTVVPTRTTTVFKTTTLARTKTLSRTTTLNRALTIVQTVTGTTDITVTTIASETDLSTSTSLATVEETDTLTETATAVETEYETTTIPYPVPTTTASGLIKKRSAKPTKPAYASACDNAAYTRACSCVGIKPKTTTKAAVVKTLYKTRTAYKTLTSYKTFTVYKTNVATRTSQAPAVTQTNVVSLTTYTTIISGTAITATETVTLTESATLTQTTVIVSTQTADPVPPTCIGKGFSFRPSGTARLSNGWGMGMINSIGEGIYARLYSGGASPFIFDASNSLQSWYSGSDYEYYIKTGTLPGAAAKVWIKSVRSNVSYTWAGTRLDFTLGDGPDYELKGVSPGTTYMVTFCQHPVYYEWTLHVYTDVSQLAGMTCTNDGVIKTTCVL